ncbi:MAG: hypothetical protein M3Q27_09020 [Actinomycetota bacterium]|nr:hypothetical protein [Actinomycetota bacterium]
MRIAQGSADVLSLGQALRLSALVPGAQFRWLALAGHSSVGDVPDRVVELVDAVATAAAADRASAGSGPAGED